MKRYLLAVLAGVILGALFIGHPIMAHSPILEIGRYQVISIWNKSAIKIDTATGQTQMLAPSNSGEVARDFAWFDIGHIQQPKNSTNPFEENTSESTPVTEKNPLDEMYENYKK